MLAECRIRRLKIHSQETVVVPRITALLEEAIRTASLPGIPANGVLCVRRLDLGRITTSTNSRFLSRRMDQLVRNLTPAQITVEAPEQDAAVVWFADDIEPYRCFSELLANGRLPRAWYWPAVIPGWSPSMSEPESLLVCVSQLVQKSTGITGLSYALEPLVRTGAMLTVLQKVRPRQLGAIINCLPLTLVPNTISGCKAHNTSVVNISASITQPPDGNADEPPRHLPRRGLPVPTEAERLCIDGEPRPRHARRTFEGRLQPTPRRR